MAKLPVPERGQPLDVTYIYSLVDTINDLSSQNSSATFNYTEIERGTQKENIKTSQAKIVGKYIDVVNDSAISAGNEKTFSATISDFKYPPIVSATIENFSNTPAGKDVRVVLTSVTTSRIEGVVKFGTSGNLTIGVHLLAIGIPN